MKRFCVVGALVVMTSLAYAKPALACSCSGGSVRGDFRAADSVFMAKVATIEAVGPMPNGHDRTVIVTFLISGFWKGVVSQQIQVKTHLLGSTCGFPFQQGQEYLVFAAKTKILGEPSVGLETMACTGLNELPGAASIIKQLGRPKGPPTAK